MCHTLFKTLALWVKIIHLSLHLSISSCWLLNCHAKENLICRMLHYLTRFIETNIFQCTQDGCVVKCDHFLCELHVHSRKSRTDIDAEGWWWSDSWTNSRWEKQDGSAEAVWRHTAHPQPCEVRREIIKERFSPLDLHVPIGYAVTQMDFKWKDKLTFIFSLMFHDMTMFGWHTCK